MKSWLVKNNFIKALGIFIVFAIFIVGVSVYFLYDEIMIGPAYILLALLGILILKFTKITLKEVYPDVIFGIIDNGFLIFTTVLGGKIAGVAGAVLGGAAGNTLTDGFGGLIEGKIAQKLRHDHFEENRTAFSTMMGKVIGCLLGAGFGLIIVWLIGEIWNNFF
jgi:hypothetical protein